METPTIIEFSKIGSQEIGYISVAEYQNNIPFDIKRVYWTFDTPVEITRGHHAHKDLEQCIFALSGSIEFKLIDKTGKSYEFLLDSPEKGLYIPPMHWRTINFSHEAVLLCLASEVYDESDYIRNFDQFQLL